MSPVSSDDVSIVAITHNRREEVLHTLARLRELADRVPIIVVDNASVDGTAAAIAAAHPDVLVRRLERNLGAAARNVGVAAVTTPYVAFCDDDTWWAPGALARAAAILDRFPTLAAVTARVLVEPGGREDPTNARMAASPLDNTLGIPGTRIIGVMAGACMMRRAAFLQARGYERRFFLGAEEQLLAIDLAALGWSMAYVPEVVVHHRPSTARDARGRARLLLRNRLWCAWLRRPLRAALRETLREMRAVATAAVLAPAVVDALAGATWVLRERRVVPPEVEEAIERVRAQPVESVASDAGSAAGRRSPPPPPAGRPPTAGA